MVRRKRKRRSALSLQISVVSRRISAVDRRLNGIEEQLNRVEEFQRTIEQLLTMVVSKEFGLPAERITQVEQGNGSNSST
jgi:hypothetical protein